MTQQEAGADRLLATIEARIKRARSAGDLRCTHVQLNAFQRDSYSQASPLIRARFYILRGALYAKAARKNQSGWLGSSVEVLQWALEHFDNALDALKRADQHDPQVEALRRLSTYEALVASSVIRLWNETPNPQIEFDTSVLTSDQQRKVRGALKHHYSLESTF